MNSTKEVWRPAAVLLLLLTVLTGAAYPLVITGIAQLALPHQANGSLIKEGERTIGSTLIGQPFADPKYFWSRPSATSPTEYHAGASGGSNLGPTNSKLDDAVRIRIQKLRDADPGNSGVVPIDLVTTSASGLDPHISPAAAEYQASRVARLRGLPIERVRELIARHTGGRTLGVLGEPRVNVLELNLALDGRETK
jgi:K+-transporting ATPase ATPase C chain